MATWPLCIVVDTRSGGVSATTRPTARQEVVEVIDNLEGLEEALERWEMTPATVYAINVEGPSDAIVMTRWCGEFFHTITRDLERDGFPYQVRGFVRGPQNPWLRASAE